jgi:hypothetical protein
MSLNQITSFARPSLAGTETHPVVYGAFQIFPFLAFLPQEFVGLCPDKFLAKR